jgi:hypothetical protein
MSDPERLVIFASALSAAGGVLEGRDLTTSEMSAVSAYASALKVEVQRAGFHSIGEIQKRLPEVKSDSAAG